MRHICPISGKDSLATAILLKEHSPELSIEYVWCDTGWELPEVHEWIDRVEKSIGSIHRCGDNLDDIVEEQGLLPSHFRRFCTKYAKIQPMRDWLGKSPRCLYLGLRSDEDERIIGLKPSANESLKFPLHDHGVEIDGVWEIVSKSGLTPPQFIWEWMVSRVEELGGKRPEGLKDWEWDSLFSGRSRANCDRCFYQRLYEWVWLYETHPNLFWDAVETENSTQHKSDFKIIRKDFPLSRIVDRAGEIKEKRARKIIKIIETIRDGKDLSDQDQLSRVSCGMYCGK